MRAQKKSSNKKYRDENKSKRQAYDEKNKQKIKKQKQDAYQNHKEEIKQKNQRRKVEHQMSKPDKKEKTAARKRANKRKSYDPCRRSQRYEEGKDDKIVATKSKQLLLPDENINCIGCDYTFKKTVHSETFC